MNKRERFNVSCGIFTYKETFTCKRKPDIKMEIGICLSVYNIINIYESGKILLANLKLTEP